MHLQGGVAVEDPEGLLFDGEPPVVEVELIPDKGKQPNTVRMGTRDPHEAVRYLGTMVTDTTWWVEAEKVAAEKARRGAGKMRQVKVQSL